MMESLIVGMGEVGESLYTALSPFYAIQTKDLEDKPVEECDVMHVCIRYSPDFLKTVWGYIAVAKPRLIDICTTVPPGTTEVFDDNAVHSTTRGLHPRLYDGLRTITKHIGGPRSDDVAAYYAVAGIPCVTHRLARTTEVAHLLNNISYGVNLAFADEMARVCRHYGVDYQEAVLRYTASHNDGFRRLDHESKCRPLLTPPGGRIGGHCVVQAAQMLRDSMADEGVEIGMSDMVAAYNGDDV